MGAAAVPIAIAVVGSVAAAGAQALMSSKPKIPAAPPPINRNIAADAARQDTEFRRRRGAGANELTGGGAEAQTGGGKVLLGQ